ncbi:hypothetical protein ACSFCX_03565 [Yokenella regensburgei]|uniref:hypothetical protein n=1 Tax=Yokenella regensburgei TaxID=158877 RepID=UPI003EDAA087
MLLTTKRYMFYVDANSTIHFSALADTCQPARSSSPLSINKTLSDGKNLVSGFLQKLAQKRQRAVEDYIDTLLP